MMRTGAMLLRLARWRPQIGVESLILLGCAYLALMFNDEFWQVLLAQRSIGAFATWRLLIGTFVALCGLHFTALACVAGRHTVKPLLALLLVASAMATYYMDRYAVYMNPDMLGNILHTEYKEARELITFGFAWQVLLATIAPLLLLWRMRLTRHPWPQAIAVRAFSVLAALALATGGLALAYRDLSSLMRNQKEARYLVTPGSLLYSTARVLVSDARQTQHALVSVGVDAHVAVRASVRPRLLVIVVGETVRAQNWGLNGYSRDTTPQLRALDVVNFSDVHSCGTATEVSLPCMFAAVGRRDYDEADIRSKESLLHVLAHAGIDTLWRDNQTGCKGVCAGLPFLQLNGEQDPALCRDGLCFDEILLRDLRRQIDTANGDLVVVLHPLGNHGPSYYLRYPQRFRRFVPTCDSAELGDCSREQVINSYDNAVLYADHVVSETIRMLQAQSSHDSALLYVSDHGESLGEQGIFLHGIPYSIAPQSQTTVPMVAWLSPGLARNAAIDVDCLHRESAATYSHDHLFHSVLGLLDVQTQAYEPELDLFRSCRAPDAEAIDPFPGYHASALR